MILTEVVRGVRTKHDGSEGSDTGPIGQGFLGLVTASDAPASTSLKNSAAVISHPKESCTNWAFSRLTSAMAAIDNDPAWDSCHGNTDLLSPGSASSELFARYRCSRLASGETTMPMMESQCHAGLGRQIQGGGAGKTSLLSGLFTLGRVLT